MKKIILTAFFAVIAMTSVNAQTSFGLKAGLNVSNLTGDLEDNKSLVGGQFGLFVEVGLSETLALQPELMFSMQGAKFKEGGVSADLKMNYINIPLIFKYELTELINIEFGPQVGFLVSSELENFDVSDDFEPVDFGGNLGMSYDITENFILGTRYNFGLTTVADDDDFDVKNAVITFSVGYKF